MRDACMCFIQCAPSILGSRPNPSGLLAFQTLHSSFHRHHVGFSFFSVHCIRPAALPAMKRARMSIPGLPITPAPPPRQEQRGAETWPQAAEFAAIWDAATGGPHLVLIANNASSAIPIHGDDASFTHSYLKDMKTTKSNGDPGQDSTEADPLHLRTLLIKNGYGTGEDMGLITTMEAHVPLRPGHPSKGPWATIRASGCATNKRDRERLAKLAMVTNLYAQGLATTEWNANLESEAPGWTPQQFVTLLVDKVISELQACLQASQLANPPDLQHRWEREKRRWGPPPVRAIEDAPPRQPQPMAASAAPAPIQGAPRVTAPPSGPPTHKESEQDKLTRIESESDAGTASKHRPPQPRPPLADSDTCRLVERPSTVSSADPSPPPAKRRRRRSHRHRTQEDEIPAAKSSGRVRSQSRQSQTQQPGASSGAAARSDDRSARSEPAAAQPPPATTASARARGGSAPRTRDGSAGPSPGRAPNAAALRHSRSRSPPSTVTMAHSGALVLRMFDFATQDDRTVEVCRNWNRDQCADGACPRAHVCSFCNGFHALKFCPTPPGSRQQPADWQTRRRRAQR
jgi:hypothetical protein